MPSEDEVQIAKRALAKNSCPYCGIIITAHQVIRPGHCDAQHCATAHSIKGFKDREHIRRQEYSKRQEDARAKVGGRLEKAAEALNQNIEDLLIAIVPFQNSPVVPLAEELREEFQAHIERIVHDAFDADPDEISMLNYDPGAAEEAPIIAAGCTACQGSCCKRGGGDNHAFLTRQTVYYMRDNDPDLEPENVIQYYLGALPVASVRGACVYQSAKGCTLQRRWRSSVCNSFYCYDIHAMHDLTDGRTDVPLAIIGVNGEEFGRVVAFDAAVSVIESD
jgi:hypothetical protein